jgi:hypothetical protein
VKIALAEHCADNDDGAGLDHFVDIFVYDDNGAEQLQTYLHDDDGDGDDE